MCVQIGFNLLVGGEVALRIACEHMDFVPSFAELVAEVRGYSTGSTHSVRKKDICQHQDSQYLKPLDSALKRGFGVPFHVAVHHLAD